MEGLADATGLAGTTGATGAMEGLADATGATRGLAAEAVKAVEARGLATIGILGTASNELLPNGSSSMIVFFATPCCAALARFAKDGLLVAMLVLLVYFFLHINAIIVFRCKTSGYEKALIA